MVTTPSLLLSKASINVLISVSFNKIPIDNNNLFISSLDNAISLNHSFLKDSISSSNSS